MLCYRSPGIASLAAQLLRGPTRLRLRQLFNIDFLLTVVEPGKAYPVDFVAHALTGYRRKPAVGDAADAELLEGELLIGELITLAEKLSESAHIDVSKWTGVIYSISDLAERFDVSTKTIFRWRRRGLVGWKFRYSDHRMRVAFPEHCVRRFVAQHGDIVERGSNFSQLTQAEREQILERARAIYAKGQTTINAVAKLLARETSRAIETIRLILKTHDDAHPRAGIFNRSKLDVGGHDQRLAVWEAYVDGTSVATVAERFGRPVSWVYRTITQMRARDMAARPIEFIPSDEFTASDAEQAIMNCPAALAPYQRDGKNGRRVPADLPPYLQQLFDLPLLTREGEAGLFRQMNYLRFKAERLRLQIDPETTTAAELDRVDALLAQAGRVKNQIIQANLRLVVSIAKRHMAPALDFFEIVSDGNVSMMRAVEKFDYSRGFKFSTYASWAIIRNYARQIPEQRYHRDRYQTGRDELLECVAEPHWDDRREDDQSVAIRRTVERMLGTLDQREGRILRQRFGLDTAGQPQTLEQIGRRFGVSKERIRQLETRAIAKLRLDFESDVEALLGS